MNPGHYNTSVNCCEKTFYCNNGKITECEIIDNKNASASYVSIQRLIT